MSDVKLFTLKKGLAEELAGSSLALEKSLQTIMERNLDTLMGVRFLASEYSTGKKHSGRIDSLGIDENGSPVIIEYKRSTNENVINQGLFYLDWLMDHKAEFKLLVMETLGKDEAEKVDWSAPRLICIAGGFTRCDEHAVKQMSRNIELVRYRRFGDDLLMLDLVNAVTAATVPDIIDGTKRKKGYKSISDTLATLEGGLLDLYEETRSFLLALGDDVQEKTLKYYVAYKRIKNFACLEVHPAKKCLTLYLKLSPDEVQLIKGFTRDVRKVGHYGTGDLEVTIDSLPAWLHAKQLIQMSYERN